MASKKELPRKEGDDSNPRGRRQYAFDDIAALNKGVTPAMATKDDFVLAYKTSSNKVQYICDNKDLLLPWAQILTARLRAAGRLGSILETETGTEKKSTMPSASMSDLTYLTEESVDESGLAISDALPHSSVMNYNIDIIQLQKRESSEQTSSILDKYDTDVAKQNYAYETESLPEKSMSEVHEASCESKFGMETASCSRATVYEGEKGHISITTDDVFPTLEPNKDVYAASVGIKKTKFTMAETADSQYTAVFNVDDFIKPPDTDSAGRHSTMRPIDEPRGPIFRELGDSAKTKGLVTDTKVIRWGKNELVDYRVST